ncbi:MAG: carboxypeptidase-like regulatory domain-containing protein [Planctomycetota bacterium]
MGDSAKLFLVILVGLAIVVTGAFWVLSGDDGPVAPSEPAEPAAAAATREEPEEGALYEATPPTRWLETAEGTPALASEPSLVQVQRRDPEGRDDVGVRGRVVNELGAPVSGATIDARRQGQPVYFVKPGGRDESIESDRDGRFEVRGLRPRESYALIVDHAEYQPRRQSQVVTGESVEDLGDIMLETGATVSGRVVAPNGAGVGGASVWAGGRVSGIPMEFHVEVDNLGGGPPMGRRKVTTAEDGSFRLAGLRPGETSLRASMTGFSRGSTGPFQLAKGQVLTGVIIALQPGLVIAGRVSDDEGHPIAGAEVQLNRFGPPEAASQDPQAKTEANGSFRIEGVSDGSHFLTASAEGFVPYRQWGVKAGSEDLRITLARGGSIRGRVVARETGDGVSGFKVWTERDGFVFLQQSGNQDQDGEGNDTFLLTGLEPGKYRVGVEAERYGRAFSTEIDVQAGKTVDNVVVKLERGAVLAGRVVAAATGEGVAGASVRLFEISKDQAAGYDAQTRFGWGPGEFDDIGIEPFPPGRSTPTKAETDAEGNFRVSGLPAATFRVDVSKDGYAPGAEATLELAAGEERSDLVVELNSGGEVTGSVIDVNGQPVVGETIRVEGPLPDKHRRESGKTGPDGIYRIEHLAAGEYKIWRGQGQAPVALGSGEGGEFFVQFAGMEPQKSDESTERIVVEEGRVTQHDFSDASLGELYGTISSSAGAVAEAQVELWLREGFSFAPKYRGKSDARGHYALERIEPGAYRLEVKVREAPIPHREEIEVKRGSQRLDRRLPGGVIMGRIVAAHDGMPVTGARMSLSAVKEESAEAETVEAYAVSISGVVSEGPGLNVINFGGGSRGIGDIHTDDNGTYVFKYVPAGTYRIALQHPSYILGEPLQVTLAEDEVKSGIDARAASAVKLKGRVTSSATGQAVNMMAVELEGEEGRHEMSFVQDDGKYKFDGLSPGRYTLRVQHPEYLPFEKEIAVDAGAETEVPIALVPK